MGDVDRFRSAEHRLWESVGAAPTERFVSLRDGTRIRVQESGDGPPVLFVHGVAVAGSSWCGLAAALPDFRCLLLDRPGCGLSDPAPAASGQQLDAFARYADDLVADVLDALDLDHAHVAATSYGGLFALRGAAAHPDRVDRIVEYSWLMGAPMAKVPVSMRASTIPGMQALTARMPITPRLVRSVLSQIGLERALETGTFTPEMLDWTVALMRETDTFVNDQRAAPRIVTPIRGLNRAVLLTDELLRRVTMPALFLWGDEDPNGGAAVAHAFVARLPDAELVVLPEAGHAPWIDQLTTCADRTRDFLSG